MLFILKQDLLNILESYNSFDLSSLNSLINLSFDKSQKFFIFVNYSSYKKNSLQSIQLNAYDYKKDINVCTSVFTLIDFKYVETFVILCDENLYFVCLNGHLHRWVRDH